MGGVVALESVHALGVESVDRFLSAQGMEREALFQFPWDPLYVFLGHEEYAL